MQLFVKRFEELSLPELYEILKIRTAVFVVEQNCPYQDPDDCDQAALHVFLKNEEGIRAYLRIMDAGVESEYVSIGRVLTLDRRQGLGTRILSEGVRIAKEYFGADADMDEVTKQVRIFAGLKTLMVERDTRCPMPQFRAMLEGTIY